MDNICSGRANTQRSDSRGFIQTGGDSAAVILQQLTEVSKSVQDMGLKLEAGQAVQVQSMDQLLRQMAGLGSGSVAAMDTQTEILKRLETNVSTLLDTNMLSAKAKEVKNTSSREVSGQLPGVPEPKENVGGQLESLQAVLMQEFRTQKETLALFKKQQDQLLREFGEMSLMPPLPLPSNGKVGAAGASASPPIPQQGTGDVGMTPVASQKTHKEEKLITVLEEEVPSMLPAENEDEFEEEELEHHALMLREGNGLADVFSADNELEHPAYHVEDFYWDTGINQLIARSNFFANFTVGVVVLNAVYIGFDSDYNNAQNIYEAEWVFQIFSQFFCVYFTWELVVRALAFVVKRNCLKDGWFKFDAFLVSTMILDTWLLMPALFVVGGSVEIPTQPLRMLRLFKLTRMARLMKAFPELVTMIKGLVRSLRAISSSMILVGLMVYVWAIMMHMLMKEEQEYNDELWRDYQLSFATMTDCIWTLLVSGTLMLDNASPLMSSLLFSHKFNYILAGIAFVSYAMMSAMCILQMLIGVLCDVVSTVKMEETNALAIGLMKQEILQHLTDHDCGDGKITQKGLAKVMNTKRSRSLLKRLRINYPFFLELQKGAYAKPDTPVPIKDVLELMVMSRGCNPATVESMAGALVTIINELGNVKSILETDIAGLEVRLGEDLKELKDAEITRSKSLMKLEHELSQDIAHLEDLGNHGKVRSSELDL